MNAFGYEHARETGHRSAIEPGIVLRFLVVDLFREHFREVIIRFAPSVYLAVSRFLRFGVS